jgi:ankyrin repeat protein
MGQLDQRHRTAGCIAAVREGHFDIADILFADPMIASKGVLWATRLGYLDLLEIALRRGGKIDAHFANGVTSLMLAVYHGNLPMAQALLGYGASLCHTDAQGNTAIMLAVQQGHYELACLLLDHEMYRDQQHVNRPTKRTRYAYADMH